MASATSRTPYGSRPEPKSLDGHEPQRSGNFAVRTDQWTTGRSGSGSSIAKAEQKVIVRLLLEHGTG